MAHDINVEKGINSHMRKISFLAMKYERKCSRNKENVTGR